MEDAFGVSGVLTYANGVETHGHFLPTPTFALAINNEAIPKLIVTSPVFRDLPAVYLHAMAYDNLRTLGAGYKRAERDLSLSSHGVVIPPPAHQRAAPPPDRGRHPLHRQSARSVQGEGRTRQQEAPGCLRAGEGCRDGTHRHGRLSQLGRLSRGLGARPATREALDALRRAWTNKAITTFADAPHWSPTKIRLLRKAGRTGDAKALTLSCSVHTPDWKRECQAANKTPAGRATR